MGFALGIWLATSGARPPTGEQAPRYGALRNRNPFNSDFEMAPSPERESARMTVFTRRTHDRDAAARLGLAGQVLKRFRFVPAGIASRWWSMIPAMAAGAGLTGRRGCRK